MHQEADGNPFLPSRREELEPFADSITEEKNEGVDYSFPFSARHDSPLMMGRKKAARALASPRPLRLATLSALFAILVTPILLVITPWQQTAVGRGQVISYNPEKRQQNIEAPIAGRIKEWLVREGQKVKAGQPLVELTDIDPQIMERLRSQRTALEQKVAAAERALVVSQRNKERQAKLAEQGISSERAYELAQLEVTQLQAELSTAQLELEELEVRISRQSSQVILAPVDGVLMRIDLPQGGVIVPEGEALALLVPESDDRIAEVWVSGIDLPLISPGRPVRLQFEGWPAVQFSGWPSVAVGTFGGIVKHVDASGDGGGSYRVLVFPDPSDAPWPDGRYLRQGVRVLSWVLLDEVSLGWELWRQSNGFPKTVEKPHDA